MTEPVDDSSAIDCLNDPLREISEKFYGMGDVIKGYGTGRVPVEYRSRSVPTQTLKG